MPQHCHPLDPEPSDGDSALHLGPVWPASAWQQEDEEEDHRILTEQSELGGGGGVDL